MIVRSVPPGSEIERVAVPALGAEITLEAILRNRLWDEHIVIRKGDATEADAVRISHRA